MMHHDEFFTPQDVDRQIDQASQQSDAEAADVEMLAYLRSHYQLDDSREQEMLGRIWSRLAPAVASSQFQREHENMSDLRDRSDYDPSRSFASRLTAGKGPIAPVGAVPGAAGRGGRSRATGIGVRRSGQTTGRDHCPCRASNGDAGRASTEPLPATHDTFAGHGDNDVRHSCISRRHGLRDECDDCLHRNASPRV